jgi:glutamate dehydrogenase
MCHITKAAADEPFGRQAHKYIAGDRLRRELDALPGCRTANLDWLLASMPPYFFITLRHDTEALTHLASRLHTLGVRQRVVLTHRSDRLIVALTDGPQAPGEAPPAFFGRHLSYAESIRSTAPLPGTASLLEVQRFEFRAAAPEGDRVAGLR